MHDAGYNNFVLAMATPCSLPLRGVVHFCHIFATCMSPRGCLTLRNGNQKTTAKTKRPQAKPEVYSALTTSRSRSGAGVRCWSASPCRP